MASTPSSVSTTSLSQNSSTPQTNSSSASSLIVFSHPLTTKLEDKNYLPWHQQITSAVQGHGLDDFLFTNSMPDQFLTAEDRLTNRINPALVLWLKQDKLLMSWILSSLGDQM